MLERYARHHLIDWWDQEKLLRSRVLVAGAGALGNEVAKNLALVGVGHLTIVDFDTIELSNLTRAVLFRDSDLGKNKADVLSERCRELSPDIRTEPVHGDVELDLGAWEYKRFDVVLACLDSIDARLSINARCQQASVPWINGGMGAIAGEVAVFTPSSACFQCTMSPDMWRRRNERFSCGWLRSVLPEKKVATTATLSALVGSIMAQEALFLIHEGLNKVSGLKPGHRLFMQVKPYSLTVAELTRDANCTAHDTISEEPSPIDSSLTPREMLHQNDSYIELNIDILGSLICQACAESDQILRPAKRYDTSLLRCPKCGSERKTEIFNVIDNNMGRLLDMPLRNLSLPKSHVISVREGTGRKYFVVKGT